MGMRRWMGLLVVSALVCLAGVANAQMGVKDVATDTKNMKIGGVYQIGSTWYGMPAVISTNGALSTQEAAPLNQQLYRQPNIVNNTLAVGVADSSAILDVRGYGCLRLNLFGIPAGGVAKSRFEIQVRAYSVPQADTAYAMRLSSAALGGSASWPAITATAYVDSVGDVGTVVPGPVNPRAGSFIYVIDPNSRLTTGWAGVTGYPYGVCVNLVTDLGGCLKANYIQIWVRNISPSGTDKIRIDLEGSAL
jgi:3D (Asp-Asp-Asp) domain-containing protein